MGKRILPKIVLALGVGKKDSLVKPWYVAILHTTYVSLKTKPVF